MVCNANVILRGQSLAKALLAGLAVLLTVPGVSASQAPAGSSRQLAGANRIEASADGCFLGEHWQGAKGSAGFSLNFFEPDADRWRQVWVSAGSIIEISGSLEDGSMVLEGDGAAEKWQPWFEGFYAKAVE